MVFKGMFDGQKEEPESATKEEMIAHVNTVVAHIKSMSYFSDFKAQTIVFWCIATYGFEELRKFPILVIMGVHRTGKTTALEMVQALANPPYIGKDNDDMELRREEMMQVGTITPAVTGQLFMRGGTHCLDEADAWDENYLTKVFDKKSGKIAKNHQTKSEGWKVLRVDIQTSLALNRRKQFRDPANKDRCIIITTRKRAGGSLDEDPNIALLAPYAEHMENISENFCDWESIPESGKNRPFEKWRVVIHVAEKLGFTEYVRKAELEIERELKDNDISEEENIAVFRHILMLTATFAQDGDSIERVNEYVATKFVREELEKEGHHISAQAVNANAKDMGFKQQIRAGESRLYIPSPPDERVAKLIEIAERIGYEDEALKD